MANKVSATPGFPYLTVTDAQQMGISRQLNVLITRITTEWSKVATRLNLALPEDGSENMTGTINVPSVTLRGATSGTTVLQATAVASGIITFPAATDTVVLLAAAQTLTNKTITSSNNTLGGVTAGFGSDATGDIYYNNAGPIARLAIGTPNQVLTVISGKPSWQTPASPPAQNFVYLGTVSVSGGALSDTTILAANNGTYRSFEFVIKSLIPAVAAAMFLQVHSGGAFQTTNYLGVATGTSSANSTSLIGNTTTTGIVLSGPGPAASDPGLNGRMTVSNLAGTGGKKVWYGNTAGINSTNAFQSTFGGYWNGGNGAIDGFQIIANATTFSSGSVDIYGIT